jgi:hypothetical protein
MEDVGYVAHLFFFLGCALTFQIIITLALLFPACTSLCIQEMTKKSSFGKPVDLRSLEKVSSLDTSLFYQLLFQMPSLEEIKL